MTSPPEFEELCDGDGNRLDRNGTCKKRFYYNGKSTLAQVLVTLAIVSSSLTFGLVITFPSLLVQKLTISNGTIPSNTNVSESLVLNEEQTSWYSSLKYITYSLGCLLGGIAQNTVGRKRGLLLMHIPLTIGWLLTSLAKSVDTLYMASIITGLAVGLAEAPGATFIGEVTEPRLRGILSALHNFAVVFGACVQYTIFILFPDWRISALINSLFSVFAVLFLLMIPDSPIWLLSKNRKTMAMKSLQWLRGWETEEHVRDEFNSLCDYTFNAKKYSNDENVFMKTIESLLDYRTLNPICLILAFHFFTLTATAYGADTYTLTIMNIINSPIQAETIMIIVKSFYFMGFLLCSLSIKKLGKRKTSLISMMSCSFVTILSGMYLYFASQIQMPWLYLTLNCVGTFLSPGIWSIPWVLVGEVFPIQTRDISAGICGIFITTMIGILTKTFVYLKNTAGFHGSFILYGCVGIFGFFYLYSNMPETEGKTFAEIETIFKQKKRHSRKQIVINN